MLVKEFEGKTKEEAVNLALETLNLTKDQLKVELIEQGKVGFFGFKKEKNVKVKVFYEEQKYSKEANKVKRYLEDLFKHMGIEVEVEVKDETEEVLFMDISSKESGLIIGKQGNNLEAIQLLVNMVFNKERHSVKKEGREKGKKIFLDVEGYCGRRELSIKNLALKTAEYVKANKQSKILPPMSPFARRVIHLVLQDMKGIGTRSEGEGPFKKVKVFLTK